LLFLESHGRVSKAQVCARVRWFAETRFKRDCPAEYAEGKAAGPKRRTFVFVNNRLEGNAIPTIPAMIEAG
jgi:hypothetical protein